MNKILVTGHALGCDIGVCEVAGVNYEWLTSNPTAILWADKILVTPSTREHFEGAKRIETCAPQTTDALDSCGSEVMRLLSERGLVEEVQPSKLVPRAVWDSLADRAGDDMTNLIEALPSHARLSDSEHGAGLLIDDQYYCKPKFTSIYCAVLLGRILEAQCLFGKSDLDVWKYKMMMDRGNKADASSASDPLSPVFQSLLPEQRLIPLGAYAETGKCTTCENREVGASGRDLRSVRDNVGRVLELRGRDEMHQLRDVLSRIVAKIAESGGVPTARELEAEFADEQRKLKERLARLFPKVKRWATTTTLVSLPLVLLGTLTGSRDVGLAAAALATMSEATKQGIALLESKYSWVGFVETLKTTGNSWRA